MGDEMPKLDTDTPSGEVLLRDVLASQRELTTAVTSLVMKIDTLLPVVQGQVTAAAVVMEAARQEMAGVVALERERIAEAKQARQEHAQAQASRWAVFRAGCGAFWAVARTPITVILSGLGAWFMLYLGVGDSAPAPASTPEPEITEEPTQ